MQGGPASHQQIAALPHVLLGRPWGLLIFCIVGPKEDLIYEYCAKDCKGQPSILTLRILRLSRQVVSGMKRNFYGSMYQIPSNHTLTLKVR